MTTRNFYTDPGPFKKPLKATSEEVEASTKIQVQMAVLKAKKRALDEQKKEIDAEIETLKKECPHTTFYDEEVFPYFYRYCGGCGQFLETI